ncbi:MAG: hypothetical protein R3F08_04200 [Dokdonella sp.]
MKVVCWADGNALYFSRAPLPWARDAFARDRAVLPVNTPFLRHIGLYAYRAGFLRLFSSLRHTPLEQVEALEQLRALEHGHDIAVALAPGTVSGRRRYRRGPGRVERILAGRRPA